MTILFGACPECGSWEWTSWERDEEGVNLKVKCLACGFIRGRKEADKNYGRPN